MNSILKTKNLSHKYGSSWAIRDINLDIADTGIIGLLGANGAGKSTTMNIICGVLNQTHGSVYINGVNIREEPELAKMNIGFCPQNPPVYNEMTVNEYLYFAARLRKIEKNTIKKAVEEVKEKCQIGHFSSRLIGNLSGGYKQRVGIAQAIIHQPRLVVMDEPTNGLDPNQLIEARKLIREIGNDHTVLLSSHIMTEIQALCKEIIMIESGRIIFSDSINAFNNYAQPATLLVRMDNPPAIEYLMQINGITNAEFVTQSQARLHFDGDEEVTERIMAASMENGWKLREISLDKGLMDDIFKQLTTQPQQ